MAYPRSRSPFDTVFLELEFELEVDTEMFPRDIASTISLASLDTEIDFFYAKSLNTRDSRWIFSKPEIGQVETWLLSDKLPGSYESA